MQRLFLGTLIATLLCSVLHLHAQNAQTYLQQGKQKREVGSMVEAINDFSHAIRINPSLSEGYYQRGEAFLELRRYSDALQDFNKAIELRPSDSMAYYQLGLTHSALNNLSLALWNFNKSIEIAPRYEAAYTERSLVFFKLERYKAAYDDIEMALQLVPQYAKAQSIRGLLKLKQGKIDDAFEDLYYAVKSKPTLPDLRLNLAEYYKAKGQTERAIEEYSAIINLDPNHDQAYFQRAILKLSLGNNGEAQKDANKAILNNRRFLEAHVIRGIASFNLGEYPRYEYDFNFYYKYARTSKDFYFLAQHVFGYAKDGNILNEAETCALKAIRGDNSFENNLLYAQVLFKLNKTALARDYAQKAIDAAKKYQDPSHAQILIAKIDKESTDKTPPAIRITSPIASTRGVIVVEAANKITVIGTAIDESGVAKVLINGNLARLHNDGNFDGETVLREGETKIIVEAFDVKGNKGTKSITVEKQKTDVISNREKNKLLGGKHRALLFATNNYDSWGDLFNPISDAKAIKRDLEEIYGFQVELFENMSKENVMLKIREYAKKKYDNNDQLFIFFAGHGQYDEVFKEGYVVATDTKYEDESRFSYISHSNLRTYINSIPCKHIFLVMDVCFGGTFDPEMSYADARSRIDFTVDKEEMLSRKLRHTTRRYLTSGGKEYVPDGTPGKHSPFVRKFLEALRSEGGKDGILSIDEILETVAPLAPKPQTGEFGNNEPGSDFLFIKK